MKNKLKISTLLTIMVLVTSMLTILAFIPQANAHTPAWQITTHAFILAAPNPIGVGQKANIIMWVDKIPDGAAVENDIRWHDYKLTITKPDGTTETKTFPTCQDTTSAQYYSYVPDTTGTYNFKFDFPQQKYTNTEPIYGFYGPPAPSEFLNDVYIASSATTSLTVQNEEITSVSSYPLPTEYWTRPIYGENTDWWTISSNWLGWGSPQFRTIEFYRNVYIPGSVGSQTAHIMWTKPLQAGGVVGGNDFETAGDTYFEGSAYLNRYENPIIVDGKLYYSDPLSFNGILGSGPTGPVNCVDLRTGQILWSRSDITEPSFGLVWDIPTSNPNQHGVFPPLLIVPSGGASWFGPPTPLVWSAYDADTGTALFNATSVPMGAAALGPQGEYMVYSLQNYGTDESPKWYLLEWNSTNIFYVNQGGSLSPFNFGEVDVGDSAYYDYNVSASSVNAITSYPTTVVAYYNDIMLCYDGTLPSGGSPAAFGRWSDKPYTYFAINLNESKGPIGSLLWKKTYNPPAGNITVFNAGVDPTSRVFVESHKETMQWVGYSLDTGEKLWGPVGNETSLDYYGSDFGGVHVGQLAYGNLYYSGFGGICYCYDLKTGGLKWTYGNGGAGNSTNAGFYSPRGNYPTFITAIGNGVVYTETTEHTFTTPIYKGALARAINATDGTELWTLSSVTGGGGWSSSYAIADGFSTWYNGYDNQIYTVGKGPSTTTVSAGPKTATLGQSVVIEGRVLDVSAGTKQQEQAARFAQGVPVASDESMNDWMGYIYQQKPLPTNFKGVEVSLDIIDANGNYRNIGSATTDASGAYSYQWKPDIEGKYTVIASFKGTNGYWPSYSETAFAIDTATPTVTPTQPPQMSIADTYLLPGIAAMIVIIAIGFAATILVLRKRP
jgi:hypothetical protein